MIINNEFITSHLFLQYMIINNEFITSHVFLKYMIINNEFVTSHAFFEKAWADQILIMIKNSSLAFWKI